MKIPVNQLELGKPPTFQLDALASALTDKKEALGILL